jgi:hypothetical protein
MNRACLQGENSQLSHHSGDQAKDVMFYSLICIGFGLVDVFFAVDNDLVMLISYCVMMLVCSDLHLLAQRRMLER